MMDSSTLVIMPTSQDEKLSEQENEPYYSETISEHYSEMHSQDPWWEHCDTFTTRQLLGDVVGTSVLDLGCGEGRSLRNILSWGASKGVGVDISEHMINIAKRKNSDDNTEFFVQRTQPDDNIFGQFDIVTSFWVLQYMSSYEMLLSHIKMAYDNVKLGGMFCGIVSAYTDKLPLKGVSKVMNASYERQSHDEFCEIKSYIGRSSEASGVPLNIYNLYPITIERALKEVGFHNIQTIPMGLSKEGEKFFTKGDVEDSFRHVYIFKTQK